MAGVSKPRRSWESYLDEFRMVHGDIYDYIKPPRPNISQGSITIICREHGSFDQGVQDHRRGSKCPKCRFQDRGMKKRITKNQFIERANTIHNSTYDYNRVNWNGLWIKVRITCQHHGEFEQCPHDHLQKHGCPNCKSDALKQRYTKTFERFVSEARAIHGDKFDYTPGDFVDRQHKTRVICKKHGPFLVRPRDHIHKASSCPICKSKTFISALETEWLNSLGIPNDDTHRQVWIQTSKRKLCVDGYDPETQTVYLFHGDYWHGNPQFYDLSKQNGFGRTYGRLFERTLQYEADIREAGYKLIRIWESEYRAMKK